VADVWAMCGKAHMPHISVQRVRERGLAPHCDLSGLCEHVYGSSVTGIAGSFTK
jgi:hypothetical protein